MIGNSKSPRPRIPWLRFVGTLAALVGLIYLLERQGWQEILDAVRQIQGWRVLLALGIMLLSRLAVSGRWHVLLRSAGAHISPGQTIRITFAGLFASNFLPTTIGGDVARWGGAVLLGYDQAICLASLVVDRLVGMAGMALVLPLGLPAFLSQLETATFPGWTLVGIGALDIAEEGWRNRLGKMLRKGWSKVWEALMIWQHKPRSLLEALAFTGLHMLCLYGIISILITGMGDSMPFWLIAGLWSIVYFVTLLPISINGLGVQELIMAFLFTQYGGIDPKNGLTLALFMRVLPLAASLPGALFVPGILQGLEQRRVLASKGNAHG